MRSAALFLFALLASTVVWAADPPELQSPAGAWDRAGLLEGHWRQVKDGAINEEIWTDNKANAMIGLNRTVKGLEIDWEYLRLENTKSGVIYIARPKGAKEETGFLLVTATADKLVFLNPANEWPMRIEYRKTGPDALEAIVSGLEPAKGKVQTFKWTRVK